MTKVFPCLWFDGNAEEAASFYATLVPDSHVDKLDVAELELAADAG